MSHVVTGFDFVFGNKQSGNVKTMNSYSKKRVIFYSQKYPNLGLEKVKYPLHKYHKNLRDGKLLEANNMLSRNWQIISRVIPKKQARKIGFKTANLKINEYCNLYYGVYFVNVQILNIKLKNNFKGIANYGVKPTFDKNKPLLEVHLFNFDKNIYGKKLKVEFINSLEKKKSFNLLRN